MSGTKGIRLFVAGVTLVVVASLVAAVVAIGPPSEQRRKRFDERRVADLICIKAAVASYLTQHDALPANLADLAKQPGKCIKQADPETGAPYEYAATGARSYRLCANFARKSDGDRLPPSYYSEVSWEHEAGHQCFEQSEPVSKSSGS